MRIKNIVESICKKYMTRNPYELAACESIKVIELPLGGIKGYYSTCYRQRIIHINSDIPENDRWHTCAHELGHGILHPNSNTPFLRANTLFPIGRFEKEAEHFAIDLLYSDEDMREYLQYSTPQIAECLNIPVSLVEYRVSVMEKQLRFLE
jgi:Zn-dependent peptidase ImmA (M78 family)